MLESPSSLLYARMNSVLRISEEIGPNDVCVVWNKQVVRPRSYNTDTNRRTQLLISAVYLLYGDDFQTYDTKTVEGTRYYGLQAQFD